MTATLEYGEGNYIGSWSPNNPQWWITDFIPEYQDVQASDLTATVNVDFIDYPELWIAFHDKYWDDTRVSFDETPIVKIVM